MGRPAKPWYWDERGGWYVTVGGRRRLLAKGPKGKTRQGALEEFHRLMLAVGRPVETDRASMRVRDVFDLYLLDFEGQVRRGEREAETFRAYRRYLFSAVKAAGDLKIDGRLPAAFLAWANRPEWGTSNRKFALALVKMAFKWGQDVGHLAGNPLASLKLPRAGVREAVPTHEQVGAMLAAARGEPFRDLLAALRETGCRPIEVRTLTADRVDLAGGTWRVRDKCRGKTGQPFRTVYLNGAMVELSGKLVARYPAGPIFRNSAGKPWTRGAVAERFGRLAARLGYGPECTAYGFRHLFITDALQRNVDPATVAELVGHRSLDMIMRHYNKLALRTRHLSDAARAIRPAGPPPPPSRP